MRRIRDRGDFIGYVILGLVPVWHPSVIFRKAIIKKLGSYDTSFGPAEDYHLWSKIAAHGFNASIVPKFHLLQRNHMESQSVVFADAQKIQTIRAQQDFIKNFIYITQNQLPFFSNILRLEVSGLTKVNVIESAKTLENLFEIITFKLGFSQKESKTLRLRVYKRIGIGFTASKYIRMLNPKIFMLLFYLLSPMYNSKFKMYARLFASTVRKSGTLKY